MSDCRYTVNVTPFQPDRICGEPGRTYVLSDGLEVDFCDAHGPLVLAAEARVDETRRAVVPS